MRLLSCRGKRRWKPRVSAAPRKFEACLVVQGESIDDIRTGFVVADDFDLASFPAQARDDLVERTHGRDVPEMCARDVDRDSVSAILGMEGVGEPVDRSKEDLAAHPASGDAASFFARRTLRRRV